jgi:hypothetical protein
MSQLQRAKHSLNIVHRNVRVTAPGVRFAHRTSLQGGADAFAQTVMRRYEGWQARQSRLDLVFEQGRGLISHHAHYWTQVHLAPRLALTLVTGPDAPGQRPAQGLESHAVRQPVSGPPEPNRREQLVRRLVTRGKRIDLVAIPGVARIPQTGSSRGILPAMGMEEDMILPMAPARPVPRIVRRPIATITDSPPLTGEIVDVSGSWPVWPKPSRTGGTSVGSQPDIPPLDLNRLTDQVIRAIDHRIIAQRERLGRG